MKRSARTSRKLSILPAAGEPAEPRLEAMAATLRDRFDGWLDSISPTVPHAKALKNKPTRSFHKLPSLTSTDFILVNRATVRESAAHRLWPREVIEKFLAAEVITRTRKSQQTPNGGRAETSSVPPDYNS